MKSAVNKKCEAEKTSFTDIFLCKVPNCLNDTKSRFEGQKERGEGRFAAHLKYQVADSWDSRVRVDLE